MAELALVATCKHAENQVILLDNVPKKITGVYKIFSPYKESIRICQIEHRAFVAQYLPTHDKYVFCEAAKPEEWEIIGEPVTHLQAAATIASQFINQHNPP